MSPEPIRVFVLHVEQTVGGQRQNGAHWFPVMVLDHVEGYLADVAYGLDRELLDNFGCVAPSRTWECNEWFGYHPLREVFA